MPPDTRAKASEQVAEYVFSLLQSFPPSKIGLFMSTQEEVDTHFLLEKLLNEGRHILMLPRVIGKQEMDFYVYRGNERSLETSFLNIKEPKKSGIIGVPDIILVPGLAFDQSGGRVGQGGGFYDCYIERERCNIKQLIGLCYRFQVIEECPMEVHDHRMHFVATEKGVTKCKAE